MDQQKKLEILAACDFSEWRGWERAKLAGKDPSEVHGFGQILFGMGGASSYLVGGHVSEESLELLMFGYKCLSDYYATVPFEQMDPTDEDFRFLFDYKERLDEFGRKIETFAERVRANGMKASKDWLEYREVQDMIGELMKTNYRETVLK